MRKEFEKNRRNGIYDYKFNFGCVNCGYKHGEEKSLQLHHIIPLSLGGTNRDTNIVALCESCHSQVHGLTALQLHKKMIKKGMANAKAQGKRVGRPTVSIENLPNSFIRHYQKYKSKEINQIEFARLCNCTRQSIAKYVKVYEEQGK